MMSARRHLWLILASISGLAVAVLVTAAGFYIASPSQSPVAAVQQSDDTPAVGGLRYRLKPPPDESEDQPVPLPQPTVQAALSTVSPPAETPPASPPAVKEQVPAVKEQAPAVKEQAPAPLDEKASRDNDELELFNELNAALAGVLDSETAREAVMEMIALANVRRMIGQTLGPASPTGHADDAAWQQATAQLRQHFARLAGIPAVAELLDAPLRKLDEAGSPFLAALGWTSPRAGLTTESPRGEDMPNGRSEIVPPLNQPPFGYRNKLLDRYPPGQIVTLHVEGITRIGDESRAFAERIRALGLHWHTHVGPNAPAIVAVAPAHDVRSLAEKLSFAQVMKVDVGSREIWLRFDPAMLAP